MASRYFPCVFWCYKLCVFLDYYTKEASSKHGGFFMLKGSLLCKFTQSVWYQLWSKLPSRNDKVSKTRSRTVQKKLSVARFYHISTDKSFKLQSSYISGCSKLGSLVWETNCLSAKQRCSNTVKGTISSIRSFYFLYSKVFVCSLPFRPPASFLLIMLFICFTVLEYYLWGSLSISNSFTSYCFDSRETFPPKLGFPTILRGCDLGTPCSLCTTVLLFLYYFIFFLRPNLMSKFCFPPFFLSTCSFSFVLLNCILALCCYK